MDGWVVIGTELDTKPLDKRLRKLESQLENEELSLSIKAKDVEETKRQLKEVEITMRNISKANEESANRLKSLSKQYSTFNKRITEGEHLTVEEYQRYGYITNEISKLQSSQASVNLEMDKYNSKFNKLNDSLTKAETIYDKQKNKVEETKAQIIDLNNQIKKNNLQETQDKLKNIGKTTESIVKKIVRWGLAMFSIRSGYMFIRQAMSTLSQYNEKMGTDIEYIRWTLANILKPIIEYIMTLAQKLITYIIYIGKAWGLISREADFSAKAFDKTKKSLGGANKSAKELQKTLAGFDEMNILNENGSVGGLGGSGFVTPSFDLGNIADVEIPSWIKWIAENGQTVALILGSIGAALLGIKIAPFLAGILGVTEGLGKFRAGIGLVLSGLVLLVGEIVNLVLNWDQLDNKQKALAIGIAALGATLVTLGLTIAGLSGGISLLITGLVALTAALVTIIIKNNEDEKSMLSAKQATDQLRDAKDKLKESTNRYTSALDNAKKSSDDLKKAEKELQKATGDHTITGEKLFASVLAGTKTVNNMTTAELAVYKAYLNNQSAQKELNEANKELNESRKESIDKAEQEAAAIYRETGKYNEYFQAVIDGYNNKTITESQMLSATSKIYNKLDEETKRVFAQNLPENIKQAFENAGNIVEQFDKNTKVSYKEIADNSRKTFEKDIPNSLSKTNTAIDKTITKISILAGALNGAVSGGLSISVNGKKINNAKGAVYYPPKLAAGGIINQPGRGVPLAVGGERGAEGVIPLTDSQMMAQLGEAIGRNVVINTILNNYMNSRLISREQQKTSNIDDFAYNR